MAIQGVAVLLVWQIDRLTGLITPSIQLAAPYSSWLGLGLVGVGWLVHRVDDWVALTGSSSHPVNKYKVLYLGRPLIALKYDDHWSTSSSPQILTSVIKRYNAEQLKRSYLIFILDLKDRTVTEILFLDFCCYCCLIGHNFWKRADWNVICAVVTCI